MSYLIAKKFGKEGCIALQMSLGQHLVDFEEKLIKKYGFHPLELVTISRPEAYAEYSPYSFAKSEEEFETSIAELIK